MLADLLDEGERALMRRRGMTRHHQSRALAGHTKDNVSGHDERQEGVHIPRSTRAGDGGGEERREEESRLAHAP
jgi:hypothetical protein